MWAKCNIPTVAERLCTHSGRATCIINKSLATGVVPDDWKCARVTPLFKGGQRCELDNYRPILVFPAASKLLERAVHTAVHISN